MYHHIQQYGTISGSNHSAFQTSIKCNYYSFIKSRKSHFTIQVKKQLGAVGQNKFLSIEWVTKYIQASWGLLVRLIILLGHNNATKYAGSLEKLHN